MGNSPRCTPTKAHTVIKESTQTQTVMKISTNTQPVNKTNSGRIKELDIIGLLKIILFCLFNLI